MNTRSKIVKSFPSVVTKKQLQTKKRSKRVLLHFIWHLAVVIFCIGTAVFAAIGFGWFKWNNMAMAVVFGLLYLFNFKSTLYELVLLKHLRSLEAHNIEETNPQLDEELKQIIKSSNYVKKEVFAIFTSILIALPGFIHIISSGKYGFWQYFKIPFLLLVTFYICNIFWGYFKLKKNIAKTEQELFSR